MEAELVEATMLLHFRGALLFRPFIVSLFRFVDSSPLRQAQGAQGAQGRNALCSFV